MFELPYVTFDFSVTDKKQDTKKEKRKKRRRKFSQGSSWGSNHPRKQPANQVIAHLLENWQEQEGSYARETNSSSQFPDRTKTIFFD